MKLLLDTHIVLWYIANDARLSSYMKALISSRDNEVYYSLASLWEVAIKHMISVKRMPVSDEEFSDYAEKSGLKCLYLSKQHIALLKTLRRREDVKEHHDPFDRIILCQAKAENMMLMTHDSAFQGYGEACVLLV